MPELGKRYKCEVCAAEVLVTKPGAGELVCDGAPMGMLGTKPLPSSD